MTSSPDVSQETVVHLRRTFAAPRERVFQAWTEPEALRKWLSPAGCSTPVAEVDLRVGGKYRIGMQFPHEEVFYVSGIYRTVQPPEKLVFTWRWEKPEMDFGETLVTVEFHARGDATEVILTHEHFPTRDVSEQHSQGWSEIFDKLATVW